MVNLADWIKNAAKELGFFACGVSQAEKLDEFEQRLRNHLQRGFHAKMNYLKNHQEKRINPEKLMENTKSIVSLAYNYYPNQQMDEKNAYKISKYAYGADYHSILKQKLFALIDKIKDKNADIKMRAFVDTAPVFEKEWARRGGLGWIGKNTLLLSKQGSFFFLAELFLDVELDYDKAAEKTKCGNCSKCMDACPTGAIEKPYQLNAKKCIAYHTIESKENIPDGIREKLNGYIYGCDICQDVCPYNQNIKPQQDTQVNQYVFFTDEQWENLNQEKFDTYFYQSPMHRIGLEKLKSNILAVKSNNQ